VYSLRVSHAVLASRWCVVRSGLSRRHASKRSLPSCASVCSCPRGSAI
jgi:hypothetical protein